MTGERLNAQPMADRVNRSTEEAIAMARESYDRVGNQDGFQGPVDMNASIALIHGQQSLRYQVDVFEEAAAKFEAFINNIHRRAKTVHEIDFMHHDSMRQGPYFFFGRKATSRFSSVVK